ncbi:MAG: tetratricopeptide repeat protein [Armatimonadota bacterium]
MAMQSLLQQGLDHLKAHQIDEAIDVLETVTKDFPHDYRAFNYLGIAYAQKGKHNLAIGALQAALQIRSDIPSIRYNLGLAYQADGLTEMAIHEFDQVVQMDPSYHKAADALKTLQGKMNDEDTFSMNACARHPEEPAVGVCTVCRLPVCRECKTVVNDQVVCTKCNPKN